MAVANLPLPLTVCSYCGCRSLPVIARFTAEHEEIINAMGLLRRAFEAGDDAAVGVAAEEVSALLLPHTAGEERSLFAELRADPEFADHVEALCAEHHQISAGLAQVAGGDLAGAVALERLLRRHLDKEENGLFPAAAVSLDDPAWRRVITAL